MRQCPPVGGCASRTQAPDTIETRSQVTGLLERQTFVDGAHVNKGELLYVIDQRPFQAQFERALASLAQAEANLLNAQQTLARNANLIAQKAVSQQDYDNAVAQERASAALVDAEKALVRNAEVNLEYTTLRAARDGFISSSQAKPGADEPFVTHDLRRLKPSADALAASRSSRPRTGTPLDR